MGLKSFINKDLESAYLAIRSKLIFPSNKQQVQNLFIGTVQKTGSQWVKAVLSDKGIQSYTGLKSYPQRRYEWTEFQTKFPLYTFIPGLYISYGHYEEIRKPDYYKTLYIIRDPRTIIVSWYYSMLSSHTLVGKVHKYRKNLQGLDLDSGITYCIKEFYLKLAYMRTWILNQDDPNLIFIKFEDLTSQPLEEFQRIFNHINVTIPKEKLEVILRRYSKEKMREKDIQKRRGVVEETSHYRITSSNYKDIFKPHHYQLFYNLTGDLIDVLGYER